MGKLNPLGVLILMPSFYGALFWGGGLLLYCFRLIEWESANFYSLSVFFLVEMFFILSCCFNYSCYRTCAKSYSDSVDYPAVGLSRIGLAAFHLVGFLGLAKYVYDFSGGFGGVGGFFATLIAKSYLIRWEAEEVTSIGIQLSYFGWIAFALTASSVSQGRLSKAWLVPIIFQFVGNLMFIDRTRPVWIFFTTMLVFIPSGGRLELHKIFRKVLGSVVIVMALFWGIAGWVGKVQDEGAFGETSLPMALQMPYAYLTSGFAYFNRLIASSYEAEFYPVRTLYPMFKALSAIGVSEAPPSQVNVYFYVPFEVNVGTFLEPFFLDGGIVYLIVGVLVYSFLLDRLALFFLRQKDMLSLFAWANICFVVAISFFTPKISSFPIWLFLTLAILGVWYASVRRKFTNDISRG